jgi:hypothetical protein
MADNGTNAISIRCGTPSSDCNICCYPAWFIELISIPNDEYPGDLVYIDSYDKLYTSAQNGCHGCQILQSACELVVPELHDRQSSHVTFAKSGVDFYVHVYIGSLTRIVDVYTTPGKLVHSMC